VIAAGRQVYLLEHMRPAHRLLGALMDLFNPMVVRIMGANNNRRTIDTVKGLGLIIERSADMGMGGIFKLIVAHMAHDLT